jgi:CRISPR-associated endonuclease Cas1
MEPLASHTLYLRDPFNLSFTKTEGFVLKQWKTWTQRIAPPDWLYDSLIVHARRGTISVTALHELQRVGTVLSLLDQYGEPVGTFSPYAKTSKPDLQIRQMRSSADPKTAASIARRIVQGKLDNGSWLREAPKVPALDVRGVRAFESAEATEYFAAFRAKVKAVWPSAKFEIRGHPRHANKLRAVEPVNALLNFGYHLLEVRSRALLARVGLSPYFGWLHSALPDKEAAIYDLQEFERATIDRAVLAVCADKEVQAHGFVRTNEWIVRLTPATIEKMVLAVEREFSARTDNGTVEGRFLREAQALRSWVEGKNAPLAIADGPQSDPQPVSLPPKGLPFPTDMRTVGRSWGFNR